MLHKHLLARTVARVHRTNLRQRHMRLIHHEQKILGEIIHQRKRRFACLTPCQMARIILDAGAIAHLLHHLQIIIRALLQALCLQQLVMLVEIFQALAQLLADIAHRPLQILAARHIVGRRENRHMVALRQNLACQHVKLHNAVDLIVEHLDTHSLLAIRRRNNLNHIAAHAEGAALEIYIVTRILNLYQLMQNTLAVNRLAKAQRKHHIIIFLRCAQAVNAGNTRHDDNVPAFEQRTRRTMAQLINLIVNRRILLDIRVGLGNIRLRLIIIVIGNKIFHSILREERLQLACQLCRQRLVVRDNQRRLTHLVNHLRNRIGLACTRRAQQNLRAQALFHALRQLLNRLRLVTGRLEGGLNFKVHVVSPS